MKNKIIKQSALIILLISGISQLHAASAVNESFLKKINTAGDETSCSITQNGKMFVFARKSADKEDSDIYIAEFKNGKWTEPAAAAELNSDADELSPYISPDGKYILFSSDRTGSLKNSSDEMPSYDIYYSEKKDGGWEKPELLFGAVNTTDDELNPFITKEKNVLYFTRSNYYDDTKTTIIKVNYRNESWEDVSTAEISKKNGFDVYSYKKSIYKSGAYITGRKNDSSTGRDVFFADSSDSRINELSGIPGPLNTSSDEISIMELGKNSIIVASDSAGNYDLYLKKISIDTKKNSSIKKDLIIKKDLPKTFSIKVETENYPDPDGIKLNVLYFSSMKKDSWPVKTEMMSPDSSGMIRITVNSDIKRILVLPGDSGMNSFSVEFLTKNESITTSLVKITPSAAREFSVKPVYFNFNSTDIQVADIPYLHELIEHLRTNDGLQLSLIGYSDGVGSYKSNNDISLRRAEKVKEYIVKAGINKERIQAKGSGYINDKSTDTSQSRRRVESIITTQ